MEETNNSLQCPVCRSDLRPDESLAWTNGEKYVTYDRKKYNKEVLAHKKCIKQ